MDSKLQNASLRHADLKGAYLIDANLHGAFLEKADLEGANLSDAEFHGANLRYADLQGAILDGAKFDGTINLAKASLVGASVRLVDFSSTPMINEHIDEIFGDNRTTLPEGVKRPQIWPREKLDHKDYTAQWRAFAASKGVDIPE